MHEDRFVDSHDGVRLAVRDFGPRDVEGSRDLLLMHGAGSHLLSLTNLVRKLQEDENAGGPLRIVAMDARWSGQSGDSDTYRWSDLVGDVDAVIDALGLSSPIVAGHSWGGMIAAHHAAERPGVASAAINLDGHGSGDRTLYDGLDDATIDRALAIQAAMSDAQVGGINEGDDAWKAEAWTALRTASELLGVPAHRADEYTDRSFVELSPGRWRRHPSATMMDGLRGDLQLFPVYRRVECPLLIFNCKAPIPDGVGIPAEMQALLAAYRRGLTRALAELHEERPNISVVELDDVGHQDMVAQHARTVAKEVRAFLAAHP